MPRQALTNKAEPSGVEPVQRSKTALRIPPRARMRRETADLLRVECSAGVAHACDPPRSNGSLYGPMDRKRVCGDTLARAMAGARLGGTFCRIELERCMARIVQKFGGTSVADVERIKKVAQRVKCEVDCGSEVAVVVSAMAGATNQLIAWTRETSLLHDAREYDVVISAGEQVTAGLLALALQDLGIDARSWLGWQIPIATDGVHGKARIESIDAAEFRRRLAQGQVGVVAGFQGIGPRGRIAATSSPMSTASIRLIRGSLRKPASSIELPTRKCWRWRLRAPRCCRRARWRWR